MFLTRFPVTGSRRPAAAPHQHVRSQRAVDVSDAPLFPLAMASRSQHVQRSGWIGKALRAGDGANGKKDNQVCGEDSKARPRLHQSSENVMCKRNRPGCGSEPVFQPRQVPSALVPESDRRMALGWPTTRQRQLRVCTPRKQTLPVSPLLDQSSRIMCHLNPTLSAAVKHAQTSFRSRQPGLMAVQRSVVRCRGCDSVVLSLRLPRRTEPWRFSRA